MLETTGPVPDRQRSVRASFEHSWRLLAPIEQRSLAELSVFAASFTRDAAMQVAAASLPVLGALADKSLLRAHGDGRFSFHPLMQQYARGKLADATVAHKRHCEYFAQLLARFPTVEIGSGNTLGEIDAVLEDCRSAWRFAIETQATEALESMAPGWRVFARSRGARRKLLSSSTTRFTRSAKRCRAAQKQSCSAGSAPCTTATGISQAPTLRSVPRCACFAC